MRTSECEEPRWRRAVWLFVAVALLAAAAWAVKRRSAEAERMATERPVASPEVEPPGGHLDPPFAAARDATSDVPAPPLREAELRDDGTADSVPL